ncbi:hypothetical protein OSB04_002893 [Centaurea solstitialis]|uniref:Reverse transcriptase Ty1/copia-type domain-containing protein n=1 Tax=Centaurea solstitialis TaxID=347529 RepID=A0AA38WMQ8_9ASTR|nr:hypothetical protein OSB04_002893 [Centaurea solstitialis]
MALDHPQPAVKGDGMVVGTDRLKSTKKDFQKSKLDNNYRTKVIAMHFLNYDKSELNCQIGQTKLTKGKSRLLTSVSFMLGIANLQMHQMDVKIDLLNEDLEEIYMEQPKEFVAQGKENKVCKLVNTLYGLKQAPKQ